MFKKVELVTNLAILCVALLVGGILLKRYVIPEKRASAEIIRPGTKRTVPSVNWKDSRQTPDSGGQTARFCELGFQTGFGRR